MAKSRELQDLIIEKAGELFREQGYAATTIKQIAKASDCTSAALYYYYEDGKRHILREVIRRSAKEAEFMRQLPSAGSLEEFLVRLGGNLADRYHRVADLFNWIMLEFAALPEEEKRIVQSQMFDIHHALKEQIGQFVVDEETADRLAWLVFCSFRGYQQVFVKMEVGQEVDLDPASYSQFLAQIVGQGL